MLIVSKYPGVCRICSKEIRVGDRVSWTAGVKGADHATCSDEGKELASKLEVSKATDADIVIPVPDGLSYLGYQKAGVAFAKATQEGCLIADEMGLGKTIQFIGYVNASPEVHRVLIVCPASLQLNWRNEFKKWSARPISVFRLNSKSKREARQSPTADVVVYIATYDSLKKVPKDVMFDLLGLDEAQYIKNPKTARAKAVSAVKKQCNKVIALTGTPIENRPLEIFPVLQLVAPLAWDPAGLKGQAVVGAGEGAGFFKFARRYCNATKRFFGRKSFWDFSGSSNLTELQEKLRLTCMVRRLKRDVLTELPPKRRQVIQLPRNGSSEDVDAELKAWGDPTDLYEHDLERSQKRLAFSEISGARKRLAVSKCEAVVAHVKDLFEQTDKIVLFAHHHEVIHKLMADLAEFNPVCIYGETSITERQKAVESFQTNSNVRLIIGSIGAMGVGLTLTAASTVIFAELDWNPAKVSQAEDRCHRITQKNSVLVQHLVVEDSLDDRMVELILHKQAIADLALDAETLEDVSDRDVVKRTGKTFEEVALEIGCQLTDIVEECKKLRRELQYLSSRCDGAQREDGAGFNKVDARSGKSLARLETFTPSQFLFGRKMLVKYKRQLEGLK